MSPGLVVALFALSVLLGIAIGVVATVKLAVYLDDAEAKRRREDLTLGRFAADVVNDIEAL